MQSAGTSALDGREHVSKEAVIRASRLWYLRWEPPHPISPPTSGDPMTKEAAIRAITDAQAVDDLRTVLMVIVGKLHWDIEMPNSPHTLDVPVRR